MPGAAKSHAARPPVHSLSAIRAALESDDVIAAVRDGIIAHWRGQIVSAPPAQLLFDTPRGDCHVKCGYAHEERVFVVKVATGFYDNPQVGLPVNGGVVVVLSRETGAVLAVLQDQGWLTSWRTAAAGALAARAGAPRCTNRLGIVGAGHQARLQALWGARLLGGVGITVWARNAQQSRRLAEELREEGLDATATAALPDLFASCRVVITCTPATQPIVASDMVPPGTHIVALGADMPGKQELDVNVLARARIATDDRRQCLEHGELGHAVRAGCVQADDDIALGAVLAGERALRMSESDLTVVDLTGLPAQDVAIAGLVWRRLAAT